MVCISCNKESNNLRVCPFCFTPYPAQAAQKRQTQRVNRAGSPAQRLVEPLKDYYATARTFAMRQTPVVRWSGAGIIVVLFLWVVTGGGRRKFEVGVVQSEIIATPLQREEALALIRQTRTTACRRYTSRSSLSRNISTSAATDTFLSSLASARRA